MAALAQLYYDGEGVPEDKDWLTGYTGSAMPRVTAKALTDSPVSICAERVVGQDYIIACCGFS